MIPGGLVGEDIDEERWLDVGEIMVVGSVRTWASWFRLGKGGQAVTVQASSLAR